MAVDARCAGCGQQLMVRAEDLRGHVRCPRCGAKHAAASLVSVDAPIEALRASDPNEATPPASPAAGAELVPPRNPGREPLAVAGLPRGSPVRSAHDEVTRAVPAAVMGGNSARIADHGSPPVASVAPKTSTDAISRPKGGWTTPPPDTTTEQEPGLDRFADTTRRLSAAAAWLLETGAQLDQLLEGKRLGATLIASALAFGATLARNSTFGWSTLTIWLLLLFVFALARIHHVRGDNGWSLSLALGEMRDLVAAFSEAVSRVVALRGAARQMEFGMLACGLGLAVSPIVLTIRLLSLSRNTDYYVSVIGILIVVGFIVAVSGRRQLMQLRGIALPPSRAPGSSVLPETVHTLLDAHDQRSRLAIKELGSDSDLGKLIAELLTWSPRRADSERAYQRRLLWRLKKAMPEAFPEEERWLQDGTGKKIGRADLFISDGIVVEMKADPNAGEADRAVGQIRKYAEHAAEQKLGPVVLVLCDTDEVHAQRIGRALDDMRRQGHAVLAVRV